jgi:putative ABC transport system substrate-binding protein
VPELDKLGFAQGKNLLIDTRGGGPEQLPGLMHELLDAGTPDAIVAIGTEPLRVAREITKTIPIVAFGPDVVAEGFAGSFAHPGSNVTGVVILSAEMEAKRLDLLHEAVPGARRVAALLRSATSEEAMRTTAARDGIDLIVFAADSSTGYARDFANMRGARVEALAVGSHPELFRDVQRIATFAIEARLPTVCQWAEMARSGCLIGYGPSLPELYRRTAEYVARIFRGASPAELPIEQPTKFELTVNLKTARSIGVTLPTSILLRADEVIE